MKTIKMHGPTQDGSGTMVNRNVPENDLIAYKLAGYVEGHKADLATSEEYAIAREKKLGKQPAVKTTAETENEKPIVYTEADAIAQNNGKDVNEKKK